jgi:RNA recognition motif-containing protein
MRLYVGNLSFDTTENDLQDAFEQCGTVTDIKVMTDPATGRSRGFGFVTMSSTSEGQAAIESLNGKEVGGRKLAVNEARPRDSQPRDARPQRSGARPYSNSRGPRR